MKSIFRKAAALALAFIMLFQVSENCIAYAIDQARPTDGIELIVPAAIQDGGNHFFIRQDNFTISEKSPEKLYIPIQRTGNTDEAADITLKLVDMSARYGVNYTAELYKDDTQPEAVYDGIPVIDLFLNADELVETEELNAVDLGTLITGNGGSAEILDINGDPVGTVEAVPLDENGGPVNSEAEPAAEPETPAAEPETQAAEPTEPAVESEPAAKEEKPAETGEEPAVLQDGPADPEAPANEPEAPAADPTEPEPAAAAAPAAEPEDQPAEKPQYISGLTGPEALLSARSIFTDTYSDRQQYESENNILLRTPEETIAAANERQFTDQDIVEDSYPGREYSVHFDAGEEAKFIVIDPKYSSAADGDAVLMLMIKDLPFGATVPEDYNLRSVIIKDEDVPGPVTFSMAHATVYANEGKAVITVTRSGQINNLTGVMVSSQDGSAVAGDDYSGIGAKLWFSMGLTTRTIEIPVGHGAEEKDFYITISPLPDMPDTQIETATTHVYISPGEVSDAAALQAEEDWGPVWNLEDRKRTATSKVKVSGQTAEMKTKDDKLETQYISLNCNYGSYAWDGVHVEYDYHTWYSQGAVDIEKSDNGNWINIYRKKWGDCSWQRGQSADAYYGQLKAPIALSIDDWTYEVHNGFRDSHSDLYVNAVYPIKRNFTIKLAEADALAFEGFTSAQILADHEDSMLNSDLKTSCVIKTLGNFSVSRTGKTEKARLRSLVAVDSRGYTYTIGTADGSSGTIAVELTEDLINVLARSGYIEWKEDKGSYSGTITVKPVYDYVKNVTVKVNSSPYGDIVYNGKTLAGGTYTFHHGDKLTFSPNVSASWSNQMHAVGIDYESHDGSASGKLRNKETGYFVDDAWSITLTDDYYEFTQLFSEIENMVQVRVKESDLQYFDMSNGLFKGFSGTATSDGYRVFKARSKVRTNEFIELLALTRDENTVPVWTLAGNTTKYSGSGFYFFTGIQAADNMVTLSVDRTASEHALYALKGSVYTSTYNLSSENYADDQYPAEGAVFTSALSGAQTDENGNFAFKPMMLVGGTYVRYAMNYNGTVTIHEVKLPAANAAKTKAEYVSELGTFESTDAVPVSLGNIRASSWSAAGAHFSNVAVKLNNFNPNVITAIEMNGKNLTIDITVDQGQKYLYNGAEYTENVKEVILYFENQLTGSPHGRYSTVERQGFERLNWDPLTNTARLNIRQFSPDAPDKYTWGDVIMVQLVTDKKTNAYSSTMTYQPVSTGYAVITDQNYKPATYDEDIDIAGMFTGGSLTDGEGEGNTRYSFGKFPWLGSITAAITSFSYFVNQSDGAAQEILDALAAMDGESGELAAAGGAARRGGLSAAVGFKENPQGAVRTMIAVAYSQGNSTYSNAMANPYRTIDTLSSYFSAMNGSGGSTGNLIVSDQMDGNKRKFIQSELGGPYIYFTVYVGIYCDWGFIEVAKTDGSGETDISHEAVYMGAGGFYGMKLTGGYTQYVLPMYFNIEAFIDITVFLGSAADPKKTLESYYETTDHKGQDFAFNIEIMGEVGLKLTIGAGYYKLIGIRASGGVGVQLGLSLRMGDWYPELEGVKDISISTDATFTGSLDLIVTSIDLWSASWPLPLGYGWMQYFQQMRRANALIHFINEGINDHNGSEGARAEARRMADDLGKYVDAYRGTGDQLRKRIDLVRDFAYSNKIISLTEWRRVNMIRQGGIVGNIMDTVMLTDELETANTMFHTRDHVDTKWVAGQDGTLQSAFGAVWTADIVQNAVSQPASSIMSIGNNRYLLVFLDDETSRDRQMANVLKWAIFDGSDNTWTAPAILQDDGTADGKPNLVDAGDKLILSWPSIPAESYDALKTQAASELAAAGQDSGEAAVQALLEQNPDRVLALTEIYTAEFSKTKSSFGAVTRITNDIYYDDSPQAVYDSLTGDYIILYNKTAQTSSAYDNAADRLLDLVYANTNTDKTYSVLCYMLYNNQTAAQDTEGNTHGPGWATTYYFPNETSASIEAQKKSLLEWGGQRILTSVLGTGQTDPPIYDLTAAAGGNGVAVYAFTVDKDLNLDTAEDKDLYVKFYRFSDHSTYVPVKVAGDLEYTTYVPAVRDSDNRTITPSREVKAAKAVDVGQPRLIRNGGSTWLFWREDNEALMYLNISELMTAEVEVADGVKDYAVRADGTYSVDYTTGEAYTPNVERVDFGSAMTNHKFTPTDYQVITDADDNLYVVWTDIGTYMQEDPVLGTDIQMQNQGIYASALIKQQNPAEPKTQKEGGTTAAEYAQWSKPYNLTPDERSSDGIAIALDPAGGLIIVHNSYEQKFAATEDDIMYMIDHHLAGVWNDAETGNAYFLGYPFYATDLKLMITRCDAVGSVEVTDFEFSDDTPVSGQKVRVTAIVENVGLTNANGCDITIYEVSNTGKQKKVKEVSSNDIFTVNTAKTVEFEWTVPSGGPDGYMFMASAREKKSNGNHYDAIISYSDRFIAAPEFELEFVKGEQNGDAFDVEYSVTNTGNAPVPAGYTADLILEGLYGDLKDRYGMDDDLLISEDISGLAPGQTRTVSRQITLPISVFKFCGYDAVTIVLNDENGAVLQQSDHNFIELSEPMNISLNNGRALSLNANESKKAELKYDSTVFMDKNGKVSYESSDPTVLSVDEKGVMTGLSAGSAKLTATIMPSGRTAEIDVTVNGSGSSSGGSSGGGSSASGAAGAVTPAKPNADGTTTTTTNNPDGGKTETTKKTDGTSVAVTTDRNGSVKSVEATVSAKAAEEAAKTGDAVILPVNITQGTQIRVDIPDGQTVDVAVPTTNAKTSTVVYIVKADGTEELLKDCDVQNGIISAKIDSDCTLVLRDNEKKFSDVEKDRWSYDAINFVTSREIFNGNGDGTFEPFETVSRGMMTQVLFNLDRNARPAVSNFTDSDELLWFADAVGWAAGMGIVNGNEDGSFGVNDPLQREQCVTMLFRYAKLIGLDTSKRTSLAAFPDEGSVREYSSDAMQWAVAVGLINGDDGMLKPEGGCDREQLAAMITRFVKLMH